MSGTGMQGREFDFEKWRLRRFVDKLISLDECEVREEPTPLTAISSIIENSPKAVLFKQAGPERVELAGKVAGGRSRVIAALDSTPEKVYDDFLSRFANPKQIVEVPSDEAPVHAVKITGKDVDLTRLPFHPQHEFDGSCYISSGIDYVIDPATGRSNVGSRRLSLRNRYQTGTNITAPSDLKRIYEACVKRGEKLPVTFTIGSHPLDFFGATTRAQGDEHHMIATMRGEPAPFVKSLTNNILVPADAEIILEGYFDERGYCEPEGPFGEYMGYYGAIHMDPIFHCTAITMRRDAIHHTLQHGVAFNLDQTDSANITAMRTEAEAIRLLKAAGRQPVDACMRMVGGGSNTLRISLKQRTAGEAKQAIHSLFGAIMRLKHIYVFDEDIDIRDERHVEWAMGTRFQADEDLIVLKGISGMPMDPSLNGRRIGAKAGFDCTRPIGRADEIPLTRSAAKVFKGPARFQTVEQALTASPMFYADVVESVGSDDGREVAAALDALRAAGKLGRDKNGKYYLAKSEPGVTAIVGELYHDPNDGL